MDVLMENWSTLTLLVLFILALTKLFMVNVSVNLGWKGGTIFPMIYSAVATGYGVTLLIGTMGKKVEGTFAVAVVAASMLGFMMRKPVAVAAILLLCFPLTFLPALIIASILASLLGKVCGKITDQNPEEAEEDKEVNKEGNEKCKVR